MESEAAGLARIHALPLLTVRDRVWFPSTKDRLHFGITQSEAEEYPETLGEKSCNYKFGECFTNSWTA